MDDLRNVWEFLGAPDLDGDAPVESELDRYDVEGRIGEGSMAEVFRAVDRSLDRTVALKVLKDSLLLRDEARDRFRREAESMAKLSHPNIVTVHDACVEGGRLFLVMEYVEGSSLRERLNADRRDLVGILEKMARAAHAAHLKGIVHRDLKPENILVPDKGEPKLADFGVAHLVGTAGGLTRSDATIGTPMYMAPEQAAGEARKVTPRTDVYALGVILYEMLTGRPTHDGASTAEYLRKIVEETPVRPRKRRADVPVDLETVCLKALEKDPARRYGTAEAMANDLARWHRGEPVEASPPSPFGRIRFTKRKDVLAVSLAAFALFGCLLFLLWNERADRRRTKEEAERLKQFRKKDAEERARADKWLDSGRAILRNVADLVGSSKSTRTEIRVLAGRAREEFEAALREYPEYREALLLIGRSYAMEEDTVRAEAYFNRAVQGGGAFPAAQLERALLLLERQLTREYGFEGHPDDPSPILRKVAEDLDTVRASGMRQELKLVEGMIFFLRRKFPESVVKLREYAEESVSDARGWYWLAEAQFRRGDYTGAVESCRKVLRFRPRKLSAHTLLARARILKGEVQEGLHILDHAIQIFGMEVEILLDRAEARIRAGDLAGAREDFRRAIDVRPDHPGAYHDRGAFLAALGDTDGAQRDYAEALRLRPDHQATLVDRGTLYTRLGELHKALSDCNRVLSLWPKYYKGHMNRGIVHHRMDEFDRADRDFSEAIRLAPEQANPYLNRALLASSRGKQEDALKDLDKAIALNPRLALAYSNRANIYRSRGNRAEALSDLKRALAIDPQQPFAHANLGLIHKDTGDRDAAVRHLEAALLYAPKNWSLREEVERILSEVRK